MSYRTFIQDFCASAKSFEDLQQLLKANKFQYRYSEKVLLISSKGYQNDTDYSPARQEANGIVLERGTYKILYSPPYTLRTTFNEKVVNAFLKKGMYTVTYARDGTSIGLYVYDGKWNICTTNGYCMNEIKWAAKTYTELLNDCLAGFNHTFESFTALLNKKCCYSFLIRHPDMQVFNERRKDEKQTPIVPTMWFVQRTNITPTSKYYLNKTYVSDTCVRGQPIVEEKDLTISEMNKRAAAAYKTFVATGKCLYGYILRSVDVNATECNSDIIIESSIAVEIRTKWYNAGVISYCRKNNLDRTLFVCIASYLDKYHFDVFAEMFSQYMPIIEKIKLVCQCVVDKIMHDTPSEFDGNESFHQLVAAVSQGFKKNNFDTTALDTASAAEQYLSMMRHPCYRNNILYAIMSKGASPL